MLRSLQISFQKILNVYEAQLSQDKKVVNVLRTTKKNLIETIRHFTLNSAEKFHWQQIKFEEVNKRQSSKKKKKLRFFST